VAPQTGQQTDVLGGLFDQIQAARGTQICGALPGQATDALSALLGFQPGQVSPQGFDISGWQAPQQTTDYTAPQIDPSFYSDAFQKGVVQPLTSNFEQQILPALKGAAGQSAGGIYSSDASRGTQLAASNLDQQLAAAGSQYALGGAVANQAAQLQTQQLVQAARAGNVQAQQQLQQLQAQTGLTDAQLAQQAGEYNVGAGLAGAGVRAGAVGQVPQALITPYVQPATTAGLIEGAFPTLSTPQLTEQQRVQAQYADYQSQIQQTMDRIRAALGGGTATTIQPQTAVLPGQTGLLPSLVGAAGSAAGSFAGSPAGSAAIASLFSDRRLKTDIQTVGRNERLGLPVYTFRYKTDPEGIRRIGYMADEVEAKYPWAAAEDQDGIKYVSYGALALHEAFPTAA